ncbi:MAG: hypothetical protein ACPKNR_14600 [Pleomorphochaeta sp.]
MSVERDIKNLKEIIHRDAIINFNSTNGFENVHLDVTEGDKTYEYCITMVDVKNTLIINVDKLFNLETTFSGHKKETKKPDFIIFTKEPDDTPLLAILEMKNRNTTKGLTYSSYQIMGGINYSKIILEYFKLYYKIDLFYFLKNIGPFKVISKVEKRTTKPIKKKKNQPDNATLNVETIMKCCEKPIKGKVINFSNLLAQGKYINILGT